MRIKTLFSIPNGNKVTEIALRRVLVSSICSILLCMTCLISTTWAWFAVSIENSDNVIEIGPPEVTVTVDGTSFQTGGALPAREHTVVINRTVNQDDLQKKMECFVILTLQRDDTPHAIYEIVVSESASVTIKSDVEFVLSWEVSWLAPASADEISGGVIELISQDDTDSSAEQTTTPSTDAVTEPSTEATEPSEEATEPSTEATEPSTEATEPSTEPKETTDTNDN